MKHAMATQAARVCALAALSLPFAGWATNGYFAHGYSVSQDAMGGAGTAMAEDALVAAINPANIVWLGDRLDINFSDFAPLRGFTASPRGSGAGNGIFTIDPGTQDSHRRRFYIPGVGYAHHIDDDSSWGIAMYGNGGLNTVYPGGTATFGQGVPLLQAQCEGSFGGGKKLSATDTFGLCGNGVATASVDLIQLFVVPTYARKFGDSFAIGISPIFAVQQFHVLGLAAFAKFSNTPSNVSDNGYTRSFGGGFRVGAFFHPIRGVGIGASYQSRLQMTKFKRYSGLFAQNGEFDIPQSWNAGITFAPTHAQLLTFDFQRIYFHQVKSVGNDFNPNDFVNNCAFPRLFGSNAPSEACLGADGGPGFGWRNMSIYKFGYQFRYGDLKLRAGYSFARQPIPSDQVLFNILAPGVIERHITGGLAYQFTHALELEMAFAYMPDHKVTGKNPLSNSSANLVQLLAGGVLPGPQPGTANAFGPDPNDQDITLHMHQYQFTLGVGYRF